MSNSRNKKIFIATTSFGAQSDEPILLLKQSHAELKFNKFGRKLTDKEIVQQLKDVYGVIAGTESYSRDILNQLSNLKVLKPN